MFVQKNKSFLDFYIRLKISYSPKAKKNLYVFVLKKMSSLTTAN